MSYFVYAVYNSQSNKIYIGQTTDIIKRVAQHNDPSFPKFTSRYKGGWIMIYKEILLSKADMIKREKELKSYQGRKFIRQHIPG